MIHPLAEFLDRSGQSATAFAAKVGVTHSAVVKWLQGESIPLRDNMDRIVEVTGGAIGPAHFYPDASRKEPPN